MYRCRLELLLDHREHPGALLVSNFPACTSQPMPVLHPLSFPMHQSCCWPPALQMTSISSAIATNFVILGTSPATLHVATESIAGPFFARGPCLTSFGPGSSKSGAVHWREVLLVAVLPGTHVGKRAPSHLSLGFVKSGGCQAPLFPLDHHYKGNCGLKEKAVHGDWDLQ